MASAKIVVDVAQTVFFEAMLRGWAGGVRAVDAVGEPGYKQIVYKTGEFRVVDCYGVSSSTGKSAGTTKIWFRDHPVWFMGYGGFYRKEDIPFLKDVLVETYKNGLFRGGRGFSECRGVAGRGEGLFYTNDVNVNSSFLDFRGKERITSITEARLVGHHEYWGMALIDP